MEAELHYDFESPPWLSKLTQKEYTPGAGHCFGLGKRFDVFLFMPMLTDLAGTHSIDQAYMLFGRPASVTAFFRAQRGIESEVEDSFTVILQYGGDQKDLLVTVKTCVVTPMAKQLKQLVRGTEGSWVKVRDTPPTCAQVPR